MRRLRLTWIVLLAAGALAVTAPSALALSPVLVDCEAHNKLTNHYSVAQLRNAIATMPAQEREYSDCYQVIQNQLFAQIGGRHLNGNGSGGSGGSSFPVVLVVVLVVIVAGGGGLAYASWRRRGTAGPGGGGTKPPAAGV